MNNSIHHFLTTLLSQSDSSSYPIGNPLNPLDSNRSSQPLQRHLPSNQQEDDSCHDYSWTETLHEDPVKIFTQKKQIHNNSHNSMMTSHVVEEEGFDGVCNNTETPIHDIGGGEHLSNSLILSFTENELEMIESRFMKCLYSKMCQKDEQSTIINTNNVEQHQTIVYSNPNDWSNANRPIPSTTEPVLNVAHTNLSTGPLSQDSSPNFRFNSPILPKKARLLKKKKPTLNTSSFDTLSMIPGQNHQGTIHCIPPSINTSSSLLKGKVSKKRERNNSVSASPTKKTQTHGATVYRGHVSNSNSFSKESPWQFHTYSEGKRNQSENLVFFHFNPKKV